MWNIGKEPDFSLIRTTSKEAIKRTALMACNNDIKKASEIYDFFAKDMPDLPDRDPIMPSTFDQVKDTAVSLFQWGRDNQDQIIGGINMVLQLMGKQPLGVPPVTVEVPPAPIQ